MDWISVNDELPHLNTDVLFCLDLTYPFQRVRAGQLVRKSRKLYWHNLLFAFEFDEVTHWMPLPEPKARDKLDE